MELTVMERKLDWAEAEGKLQCRLGVGLAEPRRALELERSFRTNTARPCIPLPGQSRDVDHCQWHPAGDWAGHQNSLCHSQHKTKIIITIS